MFHFTPFDGTKLVHIVCKSDRLLRNFEISRKSNKMAELVECLTQTMSSDRTIRQQAEKTLQRNEKQAGKLVKFGCFARVYQI